MPGPMPYLYPPPKRPWYYPTPWRISGPGVYPMPYQLKEPTPGYLLHYPPVSNLYYRKQLPGSKVIPVRNYTEDIDMEEGFEVGETTGSKVRATV